MINIFSHLKPLILSIFLSFFTYMNIASAATLEISKNKFISYTDVGKGNVVVLVHAFPTDHSLWEPQQQELQKYFRVITLDLWGFGKSSAADGQAITMSDYADEVNALLNHLQIQKAVVGGESMGGYISLAFLEKYPDKLAGLILSDTQSIADTNETKDKREQTAKDVLENGTKNLIDNFIPKLLSANASEQDKSFLRNILDAQPATAMASALRGMALRNDTTDVLAHSLLPVLIITGELDVLVPPQQSKNMHDVAKNSRLVILKNVGHLSSLEQPNQWNQAVIEMFYK